MPTPHEEVQAAVASRYEIERELGRGGTVFDPIRGYPDLRALLTAERVGP